MEAQPLGIVVGRDAGAEEVDRARGAARQVLEVEREIADDLASGDGRDRKVIGAEAHRGNGKDQPEEDGCGDAERGCDPHREIKLHDGDRHRIGRDRHEGAVAEVGQTRDAELNQEAPREDRVDAGRREDEEPELGHQSSLALPNRPSGLSSSMRISATKARTSL